MARMEAVWRTLAFFYAWVAGIAAVVGTVLGFLYGIIDVGLTLLLGDGLDPNGMLPEYGYRLLNWPRMLLNYALFGKGEFMWLP